MDNKTNQDAQVYPPSHRDQVVIEDYRGPITELPPSTLTDAQIVAVPEVKEGKSSASPVSTTSSVVADTLARLGMGLSAASVLILAIPLGYGHSPTLYMPFERFWILTLCLAIPGFAISALSLFRYRAAKPSTVLIRSGIGLLLGIIALLLVLRVYIFG